MKGAVFIKEIKCITKLLLKEFAIFFNMEDLENIINRYNKIGFSFYIDSYWLIVKTRRYEYKIGIIKDNDGYQWYLEPYNYSYFTTKYYENKNEIKRLLFAIKENEELYMKNKILLGDYNKITSKVTKDIFKELGYEIKIVKSGKELIEEVKNYDYDIIFTNNLYYDYDGKKLINELRNLPNFKIPVVVCTIDEDRDYFINRLKFDNYIHKPMTIEKIKPILDKFLK